MSAIRNGKTLTKVKQSVVNVFIIENGKIFLMLMR